VRLARAKRRPETRLGWAVQWGTVRMLGTLSRFQRLTAVLAAPDTAALAHHELEEASGRPPRPSSQRGIGRASRTIAHRASVRSEG
jgi:hypothetical protein